PGPTRRSSDLGAPARAAGAASARAAVPGQERVRWAGIAMGKTGARELNFISDVDVMHVVAPAEEPGSEHSEGDTDGDETARAEEDGLVAIGSALARELARACSDRTSEGTLWQVD